MISVQNLNELYVYLSIHTIPVVSIDHTCFDHGEPQSGHTFAIGLHGLFAGRQES